ncbi:MAG: serine hydrolase domain-containing protein [Dichotomicrobium sp.]
MRRILLIGVAVLLLAAAAFGGYRLQQVLMVGAGYYAKMVCSGVFVSGRPADDVIAEDVLADQTSALELYSTEVDRDHGTVDVWVPSGFAWQQAIYDEGYGCHLALDAGDAQPPPDPTPIAEPPDDAPWPEGQRVADDALPAAARERLAAVLDNAFAETDPERPKRTRAVLVAHRGRLVAERYAEGFDAQTPQLGWSMAKSVTNALAGVLEFREQIAVERPAGIDLWEGVDDPRREITLDNLLRMSSGLSFDETYSGLLSDVRVMLFLRGDKAAFAADKPLECPPGACWHYSSGSSNIVSRILQDRADDDTAALARDLLFAPLGMHTAVFEPDASGTLVGSSYVHASARDWARLGLVYMRGGQWDGRTIFTQDWLDYTLEPSPKSGGDFGAHVWLRPPDWNDAEDAGAIPEDDFYFLGHDGQMVAVIPSRETVIVRLGLTRRRGPFDHARLVRSVLDALPE